MGDVGPAELLLILAVCILLFGANKLPDLARGAGQALRIFKAETRGPTDDQHHINQGDGTGADKGPAQREA